MGIQTLPIPNAAIAVALILSIHLYPSLGQDNFVAIPPEVAKQYHFDLARNYFPSPEAEKAERTKYYSDLKTLEDQKGKVTASSDNLLRALRLYDNVLVEFIRHYTYLYLRYSVNTNDEASARESSELDAEFSKRTAFLQQELIQTSAPVLEKFAAQRPALKAYLFAAESALRYRPHVLPLMEEESLNAISPLSSEWQFDLYQKLLRRTQFGSVMTPEGELDVWRQRSAIGSHPDRAVRE